jgi:anti-anti-sigma factor
MTRTPPRLLKVDFVDDVTIVEFLGEVDGVDSFTAEGDRPLWERLGMVECSEPRKLLLDLSRVEFANASFNAKMIWLLQRRKRAGGRLILCGLTEYVVEVFRITQLERVFEIHPDRAAALRALESDR